MTIGQHLYKKWWAYVLVLVLIVTLWALVYRTLDKPQDNEKLGITFIGKDFAPARLQQQLYDCMPSRSQQPIKKYSVESVVFSNDLSFANMFATRLISKDMIIVQQSQLPEDVIVGTFEPLPMEKLSPYLPQDAQFYQKDGVVYGIELTGSNNNFADFYSGEEKCYVFLIRNSLNMGGIFGKGNTSDDMALKVVQYLLEEKI